MQLAVQDVPGAMGSSPRNDEEAVEGNASKISVRWRDDIGYCN
jgi:hypothetical protein